MGGIDLIELLYWTAFLFGLGFSVLGVLGLGLGGVDHDLGGHDVDSGHELGHDGNGGGHASPLNSLTIAAFPTGLGALGLLGMRVGGLSGLSSFLFALLGALAIAALFFFGVFRPLVRSQSNSTPDIQVLLNAAAVVRVSIPTDGFGEVVLTAGGTLGPVTLSSRPGATGSLGG